MLKNALFPQLMSHSKITEYSLILKILHLYTSLLKYFPPFLLVSDLHDGDRKNERETLTTSVLTVAAGSCCGGCAAFEWVLVDDFRFRRCL